MTGRQLRCLTLSDFNPATFDALLANDPAEPRIEPIEAPFGQVNQLLLDPDASAWSHEPDLAIVWTRPHGVIESFARLLHQEDVPRARIDAEVDGFLDLVESLEDRVSSTIVPTWTLPPRPTAFASQEMNPVSGVGAALLDMNHRLVERLGRKDRFHVLDASSWLSGERSTNPKLWYLSKTPFGNDVFQRAVETVKATLRGMAGRSRKLLVVDLDDTLWGGIVGEVGWEGLRLGGHDPVGEAFVDFQRVLKGLTRRGILLGIVSKNDERNALEAVRRHPEMVLELDDFAGWRIDWTDKAGNLAALVDELNLGLQSVVFIDDSAIERGRVAEALPEVFVPDWPDDPMLYPRSLLALGCFDNPVSSDEDRSRTAMYAVERKRREARRSVGSLDEWLETLEITIRVEPLGPENLQRSAQLLNKTNQMNLSTRRMSETELSAWAEEEGRSLWTFRVADRFGDMGLTGLLGMEVEGEIARVVDYVLSCRVMGRKVEETLVAVAVEHARDLGLREVRAEYLATEKNRPCLEFWQRSGFEVDDDAPIFRWDCRAPYPVPGPVHLLGIFSAPASESRPATLSD